MSPQPFGHIIAKYWKAATGSSHPCDHSVESAADGHSSLEAHSNGRRGGERSEMRRSGAAHAEFGHVTGRIRRGLAKLANLENRPGLDDRKSVGPTVLPGPARGAPERLASPFTEAFQKRSRFLKHRCTVPAARSIMDRMDQGRAPTRARSPCWL